MSSLAAIPVARGSRVVLVIASLAAFMAFLDATIVNIAYPALGKAFPASSASSISWVLNAYNIVFAALLLPAGQLADRYSRRRLFLLGLSLFTLASGCCAFAPSLGVLVSFRIVQAMGAAILIPTGIALLLPAYSAGEQVKAIALLAAVSGVAFAAGPSVGGTLIHAVGWQGIFLINVPVGVLTLWLASVHIRPQHSPTRESLPDILGTLTMLVGVGFLALAVVQGNTWGWGGPRIVVSFALAAGLIGLSISRAARHRAPAIELDLFKTREFTVANVAVFAFAVGLAAKLLCDVLFMTSVWHYSEIRTGLAVSASPLITAVLASSAARLAIRWGNRAASGLGGVLYAAGCVWYLQQMGPTAHYLTEYLPGTILTGSGIALILPTLTSTAVLAVPSSRLAAGAGINSMIRQLGAVLGVALFVAVVGSPSLSNPVPAFHHGWMLAAIASGTAALATTALATSKAEARAFQRLARTRTRPGRAT